MKAKKARVCLVSTNDFMFIHLKIQVEWNQSPHFFFPKKLMLLLSVFDILF